jgi:hypothetical protein
LDNTLGALLIGGLIATTLWGIASAQTFAYFQYRGDDLLSFKLLIAFLWCLDTLDTILGCHILYHYLVSNYMNPLAIASPVWSLVIHVAVTSVTDCIIRCLFARRVYRLSHGNIILTAGIVVITIVDLACGITITAKAFHISLYSELDRLSTLFYLNFAAGFSGDLYVAIALCFYLHRSRTGFQRTDNLITVLMGYTINTGLLTSIDALLGMVFYIIMPTNLIFAIFYLCLPKLYLNSYLATVNAREHLRNKSDGAVSIHLSHLSPRSGTYNTGSDLQPSTAVQKQSNELAITVETEVSRKTDKYGEYEKSKHGRPRLNGEGSV